MLNNLSTTYANPYAGYAAPTTAPVATAPAAAFLAPSVPADGLHASALLAYLPAEGITGPVHAARMALAAWQRAESLPVGSEKEASTKAAQLFSKLATDASFSQSLARLDGQSGDAGTISKKDLGYLAKGKEYLSLSDVGPIPTLNDSLKSQLTALSTMVSPEMVNSYDVSGRPQAAAYPQAYPPAALYQQGAAPQTAPYGQAYAPQAYPAPYGQAPIATGAGGTVSAEDKRLDAVMSSILGGVSSSLSGGNFNLMTGLSGTNPLASAMPAPAAQAYAPQPTAYGQGYASAMVLPAQPLPYASVAPQVAYSVPVGSAAYAGAYGSVAAQPSTQAYSAASIGVPSGLGGTIAGINQAVHAQPHAVILYPPAAPAPPAYRY